MLRFCPLIVASSRKCRRFRTSYGLEDDESLHSGNSPRLCKYFWKLPRFTAKGPFLEYILKRSPQGISSKIHENKLNGFNKVLSAFFDCAGPPVGAGKFLAVGNVPVAVSVYNGRKFITHIPASAKHLCAQTNRPCKKTAVR
jgi:hypothetical protein